MGDLNRVEQLHEPKLTDIVFTFSKYKDHTLTEVVEMGDIQFLEHISKGKRITHHLQLFDMVNELLATKAKVSYYM